jgi:hypothetical protein
MSPEHSQGNQRNEQRPGGKRQTLGKVSTLGLYSIELEDEIDFSQLLRGKACTLLCTVNSNGIDIKTQGLIDTRANGFIFINTKIAELARKHLNL